MNNAKIHNKGNPFVYGETVAGEYFANRVEELKTLEQDLVDGQTLFLIAPRRYGKTSLVLKLFQNLKNKGVITVYVDLYRCASLGQFLNQYLNLVLNASETKLNKVTRFITELLPSIRPKLSMAADGSVTAEIAFSPLEKDLSKISAEILDLPYRIAKQKKKKFAIAFDEFQEIKNYNGESTEKTFRSVIQHHREVGYLFAGSKKHIIKDMIYREDRAFYKAGKVMNLGKISRADFAAFIAKKFETTGFKIGPETIEEILKISNDCPHYVQYLCHELWDNFSNTRKLEKNSVGIVLEKIVAEESPIYLTIWDELTLLQRRLLQAIAKIGGRNIFSQEFALQNELTSASSVQTSANLLMDKGILDRDNGDYYIEDIFFKYWILKFGIPSAKK